MIAMAVWARATTVHGQPSTPHVGQFVGHSENWKLPK